MSLILVQHFIYNSTSYNCYLDSGNNSGVVQATGPNPVNDIPFPIPGYGVNPGDQVAQFCSDNPTTTQVTCYLATHTPFFTFTLAANSPSCPIVPPTPGCDASISSVTVTNQSETGVNNGSAIINGSTSHGPLTYSIDGTTYQSSNTFTGLAPGNYTAYIKDANGCQGSQTFSIQTYLNPVQNFEDDLPTVIVQPNNISKWNAAFNPIVVSFQRKDYTIVSLRKSGGTQIAVTINTVLPFAQQQLALNDVIYLKTQYYEYYGTIDSYSSVGSQGVLLITDTYTIDDNGGYLNVNGAKPGYYIDVLIIYGLDPSHQKTINPQYSPNNKGACRADLAPFLQTLIDFKDNYDYVSASYSDISQNASYKLQFRELWTGGNGSWFSAPYPLYVTRAAMQLGEANNGNMAKYVPFQSVTSQSDRAKFLTDYNQPIFFQGMPFELSFIYSEDIINKKLYLELTPDCGGAVDGLLLNADATYLTDVDAGRFIISRSQIESIPVITALGINRVLIPDVFDCCATKIVANLYYQDSGNPATINYSLSENAPGPDYVDGGLIIFDNGVNKVYHETSITDSYTIDAGHSVTFRATSFGPSTASVKKLTMTLTKNGILVFAQTLDPVNQGDILSYDAIVLPGATYVFTVVADDKGDDVTPVNIPDDTPVSTNKTYVMQPLTIRSECVCEGPYVYLKWINHLGAWDYYYFSFNQFLNAAVSNDQSVKRFVTNWTNDDTIEDNLAKSSIRSLKVGATQIDKDTANALQWARKSIKAMMLVSTNPVKWQTVIVKDGNTDTIQSRKPYSDVAFELLLPSENIQNQ